MQERILIAPNETELLRTLAQRGISTIGLRVMQPAELAEFMLIRSGIPLAEPEITADTEAALIKHFLPEISYFHSASYHDAQNLAQTLRMLRLQITGDERKTIAEGLSKSPFSEKNAALLSVYDRYVDTLHQRGMTDMIGKMRTALRCAKPLTAQCIMLQEFPLSPLEQAVVSLAANGNPKTFRMRELFEKEEKPFSLPPITEAYGAANETESVIAEIFRKKTAPDRCTVALTDVHYAQLFFEAAARFDLNVTFGCGLPVTLSNPAAVLRDYHFWMADGHCGIDALRDLLTHPCFDTGQFCADFSICNLEKFIQTAGSMRLSADPAENARRIEQYRAGGDRDEILLAQLNAVFIELGMNCAELIRRYAVIRKSELGTLDKAAVQKICNTLEHFTEMTGEPVGRLIPDLLRIRICAQNSKQGALHITTISGALTSLRDNLFVIGLSAELFPGEPKENYLMLDDELAVFGENAPTSRNLIRQTQTSLYHLLQTADSLGVHTELSYCSYDTAELKENNASSVLYALYLKSGGTDEKAFYGSVRKTAYFSANLPGLTEIGRAYLSGETVAGTPAEVSEEPDVSGTISVLSPSRIEQYVSCPKLFCYENIMHLDIQDTDNVFQVVSPRKLGTLVHQAMEFCSGKLPEHEAFIENAKMIFERYLSERPPMNRQDAKQAHQDFIKAADNGYHAIMDLEITKAEEDIHAEYRCGITVHGRPDALAKLPDGSFRILDYKSGRSKKHTDHDWQSCIQVMLYADMMQQHGIHVTSGDYLYLYLDQTVSCEYTQERHEQIESLLDEITDAVKNSSFPAKASKENCRYCLYKTICAEGSVI